MDKTILSRFVDTFFWKMPDKKEAYVHVREHVVPTEKSHHCCKLKLCVLKCLRNAFISYNKIHNKERKRKAKMRGI